MKTSLNLNFVNVSPTNIDLIFVINYETIFCKNPFLAQKHIEKSIEKHFNITESVYGLSITHIITPISIQSITPHQLATEIDKYIFSQLH